MKNGDRFAECMSKRERIAADVLCALVASPRGPVPRAPGQVAGTNVHYAELAVSCADALLERLAMEDE